MDENTVVKIGPGFLSVKEMKVVLAEQLKSWPTGFHAKTILIKADSYLK